MWCGGMSRRLMVAPCQPCRPPCPTGPWPSSWTSLNLVRSFTWALHTGTQIHMCPVVDCGGGLRWWYKWDVEPFSVEGSPRRLRAGCGPTWVLSRRFSSSSPRMPLLLLWLLLSLLQMGCLCFRLSAAWVHLSSWTGWGRCAWTGAGSACNFPAPWCLCGLVWSYCGVPAPALRIQGS